MQFEILYFVILNTTILFVKMVMNFIIFPLCIKLFYQQIYKFFILNFSYFTYKIRPKMTSNKTESRLVSMNFKRIKIQNMKGNHPY